MSTLVKVILVLVAVTAFSCCGLMGFAVLKLRDLGGHYELADGKAYWVSALNHDFRQARFEIAEADLPSFQAFSFGKGQWASDKNHVYFEGRILRSADPNDFQIIDREKHLSRSGNNEYKRARKTKNDAEQFVSLGQYSSDMYGAYWFDREIPGADPKTFELFAKPETEYKNDSAWAVDSKAVFCDGVRLEGCEPASFRLLGYDYGTDGHRIYYESKLLPEADPQAFVVTYHEKKYVVGYDGKFIWQFGECDVATDQQKALLRPEQKKQN